MTMDMVQYDCPYIDVTDDVDVSFYTMHWDFDSARQELETRILVEGADRGALDEGLDALADHDRMLGFDLLSRRGETGVIRSYIGETDAMRAIRENGGYITGPFKIREGSELWNVGFDSPDAADGALSALETANDFRVEARNDVTPEDFFDIVQNVDVAKALFEGCRTLSSVERETLRRAVEGGYFETPRDATLSTLASEFDVSKTAVSKNLRRSERKVLERVVAAAADLDGDGFEPRQ